MSLVATSSGRLHARPDPSVLADVEERAATRIVCFLLLPACSMLAFAAAIEPLRVANEIANCPLFEWQVISSDGAAVQCSNGLYIPVDGAVDHVNDCWAIVICGGRNSHLISDRVTEACLRRLRFHGAKIGAVSDGAYVLARAGLLDRSHCEVHWNCIDGFAERFPEIKLDDAMYHIEGDRFTCSGGTASLDLMLKLIEIEYARDLAMAIAERFIHGMIREPETRQRLSKSKCYELANRFLGKAIGVMEDHLEETRSIESICQAVGVSTRQLQRLFAIHTKCTPSRFYLQLRLQRARSLLASSTLTVTEIAVASGFRSMSHFAKCYRVLFGAAPRHDRRLMVT